MHCEFVKKRARKGKKYENERKIYRDTETERTKGREAEGKIGRTTDSETDRQRRREAERQRDRDTNTDHCKSSTICVTSKAE